MGRSKQKCNSRRSGVATVEFAIVCSLLFMILFAGFEFSRINMIRNTIENAAYEGARQGILPGATSSECVAAAQGYLDTLGVQSSSIVTSPSTIDSSVRDITVTVGVTMDGSNGYIFPRFFLGKTLEASITLPRES